jgi:hypothetical protein
LQTLVRRQTSLLRRSTAFEQERTRLSFYFEKVEPALRCYSSSSLERTMMALLASIGGGSSGAPRDLAGNSGGGGPLLPNGACVRCGTTPAADNSMSAALRLRAALLLLLLLLLCDEVGGCSIASISYINLGVESLVDLCVAATAPLDTGAALASEDISVSNGVELAAIDDDDDDCTLVDEADVVVVVVVVGCVVATDAVVVVGGGGGADVVTVAVVVVMVVGIVIDVAAVVVVVVAVVVAADKAIGSVVEALLSTTAVEAGLVRVVASFVGSCGSTIVVALLCVVTCVVAAGVVDVAAAS